MRWGWAQYGQLSLVLSFKAATALSLRSLSVATGLPVTGQMNFSGGMATAVLGQAQWHAAIIWQRPQHRLTVPKSCQIVPSLENIMTKPSCLSGERSKINSALRSIVARGDRGSN